MLSRQNVIELMGLCIDLLDNLNLDYTSDNAFVVRNLKESVLVDRNSH